MRSYANTRDANEPEMLAVCRQIGATTFQLDEPADYLIGFRGINLLVEFKLPPGPRGGTSHSKQTDKQVDFERTWRGQYAVVRTAEELLELLTGSSTWP
jgi:hypothetical protein